MKVVGLDLRFWAKVAKGEPDECWPWQGHIDKRSGYGRLSVGGRAGRMEGAHRVAVFLETGEWPPKGMDVDHLCRVHACVNIRHLEVVTHQLNNQRGIAGEVNGARQLAITHCPRNHSYDERNTGVRQDGRRRCRECDRLATAARRMRAKEAMAA